VRASELLNERVSSIVYHYTPLASAKNILSSGNFELSSSLGSIEQQYQPKGYPYFLSTTRTRRGGYHANNPGNSGVLFVLNGDWYNRHYKSAPIDYWQERGNLSPGRSSEAEDRIFSKEPAMSIGGVTEIHVYVNPEKVTDTIKARARQVIILAKKLGLPAYFYTDPAAWMSFDKRNLGDIKVLTGQEHLGGYTSTHKGWLSPWVELLYAKTKDQLGEKANQIRYGLAYANDYNLKQSAQGLANDMSNARKPGSGKDRENAVKIINFMRKNKLDTLSDFVSYLSNKWKPAQK
jgi:hypothetical protein